MQVSGVRILAMLLVFAGTANAQQQISPDLFLDQAVGKTLTFTDYNSGQTVGVEQFLRRDLSVWAQSNGRCSYGHIEIRGPLMCFIYESFPNPDNCWMPFQSDGEILVMSAMNRQIQRVTQYTTEPVVCEGAPMT